MKVEEVIQDKVVDEVKDLIQDSSEESLEEEEQHITSRERSFKNSVWLWTQDEWLKLLEKEEFTTVLVSFGIHGRLSHAWR